MTDNAYPIVSLGDKPPSSVRKRDRARFLTQELKASVQGLLHRGDDDDDDDQSSSPQDELFDDTAFDPQNALRQESHEEKGKSSISERLTVGAKTAVNTIKNPKAVGRNQYTRNAVAKMASHPHFQSTALDDELLDAHDDLTSAQGRYNTSKQDQAGTPIHAEHAVKVVDAQSTVHRVEAQRENLKSGWVLGRHVVRVKAVRPISSKPERHEFLSRPMGPGKPPRLQMGPHLGRLILWYTTSFTAHRIDDYDEPPFDLGELSFTIERLVAVSIPWQTFASKVRQVYCWENPSQTFQIMFAYWIIWYFQRLASFTVAYIIYFTLKNKLFPTNIQAIRERAQRSQDQSAIVREWGELIQKHGGSDWVEPLLDGLGPHLQLQLGDLTIFLERLQNFYQWANPSSTWLTLSIFLAGFVFLLIAPAQLCVDLFWMLMGFCFFFATPIATNYPKYRHVVSPLCWLFWTVPDAAELAIGQLQQKVAIRDDTRVQALRDEKLGVFPQQTQGTDITSNTSPFETQRGPGPVRPDVSDDGTDLLVQVRSSDQLKFKTNLLPSHSAGYVILTRTHITFEIDNKEVCSYPYSAIVEIFKVDLNRQSNDTSGADAKNKLSRLTHMSRSIEKSDDIQILPNGLGFIFQQDDSSNTDLHASQTTSDSGYRATTQIYASTTDTKPALDPRTISPSEDLETGPTPPADINQNQKQGITLILNKTDRDKIFAVVLAWSNMNWQPLYSLNRQAKLGSRHMGAGKKQKMPDGCKITNVNLDEAIKRALV